MLRICYSLHATDVSLGSDGNTAFQRRNARLNSLDVVIFVGIAVKQLEIRGLEIQTYDEFLLRAEPAKRWAGVGVRGFEGSGE